MNAPKLKKGAVRSFTSNKDPGRGCRTGPPWRKAWLRFRSAMMPVASCHPAAAKQSSTMASRARTHAQGSSMTCGKAKNKTKRKTKNRYLRQVCTFPRGLGTGQQLPTRQWLWTLQNVRLRLRGIGPAATGRIPGWPRGLALLMQLPPEPARRGDDGIQQRC